MFPQVFDKLASLKMCSNRFNFRFNRSDPDDSDPESPPPPVFPPEFRPSPVNRDDSDGCDREPPEIVFLCEVRRTSPVVVEPPQVVEADTDDEVVYLPQPPRVWPLVDLTEAESSDEETIVDEEDRMSMLSEKETDSETETEVGIKTFRCFKKIIMQNKNTL